MLPKRYLLLILAALFFTFSFAPSPLWFLAYFFIPLFIAAHRDLGFKEGFRHGYWFGFAISILLLYWVAIVTVTGAILLVLVHSLYYAVIGGLLGSLTRRCGFKGLIWLPFVWVGVEYLRSLTQLSFPWLNLSYTQWENLPIVQLSELSADAVVSFFIVVLGILLYLGYRHVRRPWKASIYFVLAILLYTGGYLWGASRLIPSEGDFKVAVLQGNVPNEEKWRYGSIDHNVRIYDELTRRARADSAQLVIWPETAVPSYLNQNPSYQNWVAAIAREQKVGVLTGSLHLVKEPDGTSHYHNSAYYFSPAGIQAEPYDKVKLVPFSEHIPYEEQVGLLDDFRQFVRSKLGLDISDFAPGDTIGIFSDGTMPFGVLICFEVVYPEFVRGVVNSGAEFLAVITNDAWFGETAGPHQHAVIPVFRAVENRCWIVRAANTGISEIIDPLGRIRTRAELGERAQLTTTIGGKTGMTLFARHGAVLSQICLAITFLALLIVIFGKRHHA